MTELHIKYSPGPVATLFHRDTASRVKLLIGPFGTGKTTAAAWDIIDFASERVVKKNGIKKAGLPLSGIPIRSSGTPR